MVIRNSLFALGALGALGAGYTAVAKADQRALESDPETALFDTPLEGKAIRVRAYDGTELNVREFGNVDGPTLVLAHGWMCNLHFWTRQIQALSEQLRIVAYDLRGHGESARATGGDYSIDAHADDLQAVLESVVAPHERALLAGHSLGAMTIAAWAGNYPDSVAQRISGAVLINTGTSDLVRDALVAPLPAPFDTVSTRIGAMFVSSTAPLTNRVLPIRQRFVRYIACSASATPAQVNFSAQQLSTARRDVRGACGETLVHLHVTSSLTKLIAPTTVIAGARDRLTPGVHGERIAALLPNLANHVVVPGAGHMLPLTHAEQVNREILALVATPVFANS